MEFVKDDLAVRNPLENAERERLPHVHTGRLDALALKRTHLRAEDHQPVVSATGSCGPTRRYHVATRSVHTVFTRTLTKVHTQHFNLSETSSPPC
jgi:hypothetical protein